MTSNRTDAARAHDDSPIIDDTTDAPSDGGSAGGNLQRDVATKSELDSVDDPDSSERVTKQETIDHDQAYRANRPRD